MDQLNNSQDASLPTMEGTTSELASLHSQVAQLTQLVAQLHEGQLMAQQAAAHAAQSAAEAAISAAVTSNSPSEKEGEQGDRRSITGTKVTRIWKHFEVYSGRRIHCLIRNREHD